MRIWVCVCVWRFTCVCEAQLKPAYRVSVHYSFLASFFTVLFSCAKGGANVIFDFLLAEKLCALLRGGRRRCWYLCVLVWCSFFSDNKLFSKICCLYMNTYTYVYMHSLAFKLVEPLGRINAIIEFDFISFHRIFHRFENIKFLCNSIKYSKCVKKFKALQGLLDYFTLVLTFPSNIPNLNLNVFTNQFFIVL